MGRGKIERIVLYAEGDAVYSDMDMDSPAGRALRAALRRRGLSVVKTRRTIVVDGVEITVGVVVVRGEAGGE